MSSSFLQDFVGIEVPNDPREGIFTLHHFTNNRMDVMQYTGLKDKNSVEIYEGDVLKHALTPKLYPSEVYYSDEFGGYWPLVNTTSGYKAEKWEVIGNIYENKDLLK